jgi:hypothetical protein
MVNITATTTAKAKKVTNRGSKAPTNQRKEPINANDEDDVDNDVANIVKQYTITQVKEKLGQIDLSWPLTSV